MNRKIGIISGGGQFPLLFTESAKAKGITVVAIGHRGETDPRLAEEVDCFTWVKLGQLGKIIKFFKKNGVNETVFLGSITKTRIFKDIWPDLKGLGLWKTINVKHDDAILRAIADTLEQEGIKVLASTIYLKHLLFPKGILTKNKPSKEQIADIAFGWQIAKEIGRLDIGQCVVVRKCSVLAVEAIEGTDAAIRRGGNLGHKDTVVVKIKKPGQDFRFDLPAIGLETISSMREVQAAVLAVEAEQSLLFDQAEVIKQAQKAGIVVVGISGGPDDLSLVP